MPSPTETPTRRRPDPLTLTTIRSVFLFACIVAALVAAAWTRFPPAGDAAALPESSGEGASALPLAAVRPEPEAQPGPPGPQETAASPRAGRTAPAEPDRPEPRRPALARGEDALARAERPATPYRAPSERRSDDAARLARRPVGRRAAPGRTDEPPTAPRPVRRVTPPRRGPAGTASPGEGASRADAAGEAETPPAERDASAASAPVGRDSREETPDTPTRSADGPAPGPPDTERITEPLARANLVIYVPHRAMYVRDHDRILRTWTEIGVPEDPTAPKRRAGDGRAPAGDYVVIRRVADAEGRRLLLNYPAIPDAEAARTDGRIDQETLERIEEAHMLGTPPPTDTPLGGPLRIAEAGTPAADADGAIRLSPERMDEVWAATANGATVQIRF